MFVRCLSVYVFRESPLDCTRGGVSSRFHELLVACPDGPHCFDSDKELPLNFCMIETRELPTGIHQRIVPAMIENNKIVKRPGWWMNGGNIAHTSDSRWTALKGHYYPLDIHDRREW